eukprot:TRINITY_DN29604_c0_g1_i1.p1 TRINITY_DN29604_c0_g1~~TRINITY_DN29604_c0_g1_i1.p1  ORF type:complete len:371 (+),score=131.97 TRINITY_DN29604_c0_g1_i1:55-1113(+)
MRWAAVLAALFCVSVGAVDSEQLRRLSVALSKSSNRAKIEQLLRNLGLGLGETTLQGLAAELTSNTNVDAIHRLVLGIVASTRDKREVERQVSVFMLSPSAAPRECPPRATEYEGDGLQVLRELYDRRWYQVASPGRREMKQRYARQGMWVEERDNGGFFGEAIKALGLRTGAEIGVNQGYETRLRLDYWSPCVERYHLVDPYSSLQNYKDIANDGNRNGDMVKAKNLLAQYDKGILVWERGFSVPVAAKMADKSLDFIYIDARHDYISVLEDLRAWWPKCRPGGLFAGHDFIYSNSSDLRPPNSPQDWSVQPDGSRHPGAVRGAVEDFAKEVRKVVYEVKKPTFPAWAIRC